MEKDFFHFTNILISHITYVKVSDVELKGYELKNQLVIQTRIV